MNHTIIIFFSTNLIFNSFIFKTKLSQITIQKNKRKISTIKCKL